eukprot:scaffold371_cov268-Chaetoceros_neogracile.AAC.2
MNSIARCWESDGGKHTHLLSIHDDNIIATISIWRGATVVARRPTCSVMPKKALPVNCELLAIVAIMQAFRAVDF